MTLADDFHGDRHLPAVPGEQAASAFAFVSKSTSLYTFVVLILACPSHPRIVLISTPARSRCVAVECRMVCGLTLLDRIAGSCSAARAACRSTRVWIPNRVIGCFNRFRNRGSSFGRCAIKRRRWPIVSGHNGHTRCFFPFPVI